MAEGFIHCQRIEDDIAAWKTMLSKANHKKKEARMEVLSATKLSLDEVTAFIAHCQL